MKKKNHINQRTNMWFYYKILHRKKKNEKVENLKRIFKKTKKQQQM